MKIVKPSIQVEKINPEQMLKNIEMAGRTCYKSESKITKASTATFIKMIIMRGHESVLEHEKISVRIICDRGVSHEIVRHRIASYSQESTRYCNYKNEVTFIEPCFWQNNYLLYVSWKMAMLQAEKIYQDFIKANATPQEARSVLPNSLKTELVMTANLREWRHFLKLRTAKASHPQMREIACMILKEFNKLLPEVFGVGI